MRRIGMVCGRYRYYSYYKTKAPVNGHQIRIEREPLEAGIPDLLAGLQVNPDLLLAIRQTYEAHAKQIKGPIIDIKAMLESIASEEADYTRLLLGR